VTELIAVLTTDSPGHENALPDGEIRMDRGRREPHFSATQAVYAVAEMRDPVTRISEEVHTPGIGWWSWFAISGVLIAFFAGWPLLREEASGACQAVELRALGITLASSVNRNRDNPLAGVVAEGFRRSMASGEVAAAIVRDRYQGIPSPISCTALYWHSLFDPETLQIAVRR
jgi:hypothetical protein